MSEGRKPTIVTSGLPPQIAHALEPVKQSLEMLLGQRQGEIVGLRKEATHEDVVAKVNELIARINGSGSSNVR